MSTSTIRLKLNCLIEGEDIVFPVTAECDDLVGDSKESVQRKRALGSLKDIDPHDLESWKVSAIDEPLLVCEMTLLFSAQGPHRHQTTQGSRWTYWAPGR